MKKVICILLSVMVLMCLIGCSSVNRENLYDPSNNDIILGGIYFEEDISSNATVLINAKDYIDNLGINSTNHTEFSGEVLTDLKQQMINFFYEEYDITVEEKLSNVKTIIFDSDPSLLGFHIPGENTVYINSSVYNSTPEQFAFTWCHEVIHLLGIDYKTNKYHGLYETITEAVNNQLILWMGYEYDFENAYEDVYPIGKQLILANPDIVRNSITDDSYVIEKDINEILKDANYPLGKFPDSTSVAYQFNAYLICMIDSHPLYKQHGDYLKFFVQEIATAYCRNFNLTEEQIDECKKLWIVNDFDKVTLKKVGNGATFKR